MALLYNQEADFRQERNFGQKFSATFEFIGAHWRGLGRALLTIVVPVMLVSSILTAIIQTQMTQLLLRGPVEIAQPYPDGFWARIGTLSQVMATPMYWLSIVLGTLTTTLIILTIYCYLLLYLRRSAPGPAVTVAEVWAEVRARLFANMLSLWGVGLVTMLGFLVLFIPGMYLAVGLSLFFIIRVVEGKDFGDSFSRSLFLIRGKWWSTFGLFFVTVLMLYFLFIFLAAIVGLLSGSMVGMFQLKFTESPLVATAFRAVVSLVTLLFYLPLLLVLAFQYFNLVERKEGTGLYLLVNQLGQAPAAARNNDYRPQDDGEY